MPILDDEADLCDTLAPYSKMYYGQYQQKANGKKEEMKISCYCGRNFVKVSKYRHHKKWECGKSVHCIKCNKKFKNKWNLKYHYDHAVCMKDNYRLMAQIKQKYNNFKF